MGGEGPVGALDWMTSHLRPRRILAVGHSIGGQMVGLAPNYSKISALLSVAAGERLLEALAEPRRYRMALNWFVLVPLMSRAFRYLPGWAGTVEDLPGGVAREWAAWCRRPGFLFDGRRRAPGGLRQLPPAAPRLQLRG